MQEIKGIEIDYGVRKACLLPYPNHPKGCPNYGKKSSCPPKVAQFFELVDVKNPIYIEWNEFNLKEHVDKMQVLHPSWTERQLYCCLYWQPKARKQLRLKVEKDLELLPPGYIALYAPEALGVNITKTMQNSCGIELEWPPRNRVYQVALLGKIKRHA